MNPQRQNGSKRDPWKEDPFPPGREADRFAAGEIDSSGRPVVAETLIQAGPYRPRQGDSMAQIPKKTGRSLRGKRVRSAFGFVTGLFLAVLVLVLAVTFAWNQWGPGNPHWGQHFVCTGYGTVFIDRWNGTEEDCVEGYWTSTEIEGRIAAKTCPSRTSLRAIRDDIVEPALTGASLERVGRQHARARSDAAGPVTRPSADGWGMGRAEEAVIDRVVSRGVTAAAFTDFVKSTYRVLLTRGLRGCFIAFSDGAARDFVVSRTEPNSDRPLGSRAVAG